MTTRTTVRGASIALALGLALFLGGCGAGGDSASDSGSGAAGSVANQALADEDSASSGDEKSGGGSGSLKVDTVTVTDASPQQQIRTAQVTLRVKEIDDAATQVRGIATGLGGVVQNENSSFGTPQRRSKGRSVITLRVPADQLDAAIGQLDDVGRRLDLKTSSKDVTTTVADLDSRVESQERSVERMRTLLAEAATVKDVIAIESQLSSREADLESLQAQARSVKDKVALSTLVVTLQPETVTAPEEKENHGFLAGLSAGWDFLKGAGEVALTVIGTLLPVSLAVAVIAVPAWFLYRRFSPRPSNP